MGRGLSAALRISVQLVLCPSGEWVVPLGACFLVPTMMVNRTYFGKLSPPKATTIMAQYGKEKGED